MFLCFDIGGTNIKSCLTNASGVCADKAVTPTPNSYTELMNVLTGIAENAEFEACAVAVPGTCAPKSGETIFAPNLPCINGKNIKNDLQNTTRKPVFIENDANLAALGEYYFVEKNNISSMVFLTIGTGLGGGAVLNGELLTSDISLFEAGHINIEPDGRPCGCGKKGCLEAYVNTSGILETYHMLSAHGHADNVNMVYSASKTGDKAAALTFEVFGGYLGIGMASLANILVPEKIKIGGGISEMSDAFLGHTLKVFAKNIYPAYRNRVSIELSTLKNSAGLKGCAALCLTQLSKN
ncbi:ROK family protein [Denitrovibrio acetiphilus DSM 12809]|jgi:glucokinase|uniref:ROK family protein n=1 Tax=Denitrovibrio acetiphilus (strain DSM 12809 / NBRC 114555 / N2460) TaxID=522772 RepID=D4H2W2_DENA2|nr:ROK family protein [Denitrovibrio acetiphilus]ADD68985.1 ROK family protein [Denitrovibrio acetiphilus DSM 12809]